MDAALQFTNDELDQAFQGKEFVALFQPTVSLAQLRAASAHASFQWHHPALGVLEEAIFLPTIAEFGRAREFTLFALRTAVRTCAQWREDGLDWTVSVRVPPTEFLDGHLVASIGLMLNEANLEPEHLTIDIRESDLGNQTSQFLAAFTELRTLGCGLNLSSGASTAIAQDIKALPLTEMTITGGATLQFIQRTRQAQYGLFAQRLADAQARNIRATAAGVEDEATLWAIQRAGFAAATGNYICRPLPAKGLFRWNKIWREAAEAIAASKRAAHGEQAKEAAAETPHAEAASPAPATPVKKPAAPAAAEDKPAAPPTFLRRQPASHLPMDIDQDDMGRGFVVEPEPQAAPSADKPAPQPAAIDESFEDALETELQETEETYEDAAELVPDHVDMSEDNFEDVEEEADTSAGSRVNLAEWIGTRSQASTPAANVLDDYFEGGVPPQPVQDDGAEDAIENAEDDVLPQASTTNAPEEPEAAPEEIAAAASDPVDVDDAAEPEDAEPEDEPHPAMPKVTPERLLEPAAARTVPPGPAPDPELVLVSRKIRGVDRAITMSVQNPGREGLSLKSLFKKRREK